MRGASPAHLQSVPAQRAVPRVPLARGSAYLVRARLDDLPDRRRECYFLLLRRLLPDGL